MRDYGPLTAMSGIMVLVGALMFGCLQAHADDAPHDCLDAKAFVLLHAPDVDIDEAAVDGNDWLAGHDMTDDCTDPTPPDPWFDVGEA
jgi:hypothetical protein